jgi:integrase
MSGCQRRTVDFIAHYGYVETEPKTKRSRSLRLLPAFVISMLEQHKEKQAVQRLKVGDPWHDLDLVICGLEGNYLNPRYILKMFDKLLTEAGLPHMRIHDLRHCVITLLSGEGVDPLSIQQLAGHEDIVTTLGVYGHFNPVMAQVIADKLGGLFGQGADS